MKLEPNTCIHNYEMNRTPSSSGDIYATCSKCDKQIKWCEASKYNQNLQIHNDFVLKQGISPKIEKQNDRREFWKQSALSFITTGVTTLGSDGLSSSAAGVADKLLIQYDTRVRHGDI